MSLQSLVLTQKTCQLLVEKGVKIPTVLLWIKNYVFGTDWDVYQNNVFYWDHNEDKPLYEYYPAFALSDMPSVFQELGRIKGWGSINKCPICELLVGEGDPKVDFLESEYHYLRFCVLYAESKEKAEEYVVSLIQ